MKAAMNALVLTAALATLAAACTEEDITAPPLGDYTTWKRIDTWGDLPGHGDSYRVIFANDVALTYAGGSYPEGSVLVKEVRHLGPPDPLNPGQPTAGDVRYLAIMRRLGPAPLGLDDEAGWLFTQIRSPRSSGSGGNDDVLYGGDEVYRSLCWNRCHVAAPYAGAFLDYGK